MAKHRVFVLFLLFWLTLGVSLINAQGHRISGRIVDAETLDPLPYAHVFIDQTTLGAVSDINGEYVIEDLKDGAYKLVFSYVGYEMFYHTVVVNGADVRLSARLVPQLEMLQSIEVKGTKDKEWEAKLKRFNRVFFGDTEWARECKILNPWVLDFTYDAVEKKTKATASEPIKIENKALGYYITCTLQLFAYDKSSYKIFGLYKFEEMNTADSREAAQWTRARRRAYQGSMRFLMKSIINNHEKENGFNVYKDKRPEKYVSPTGSFALELEKNLELLDAQTIKSPTGMPGLYKLTFDGRIEVHHTTQYARDKTYRDVTHPVSWIEAEKGYLIVDEEGQVQNANQVVTSGEMNHIRIAGMLPRNYSPGSFVVVNYLTKRNQAKRLQERIYLQTDKASYYLGDRIWFKAHINYQIPALRDSLSRVVYVEAIDQNDSVLTSVMLRADTLGAYGVLAIPETWQPGTYFLRAYTKWMQNYGLDVFNYTPIRLLSNELKLATSASVVLQSQDDFIVSPMEQSGDTIQYLVSLDTSVYRTWASCAVSVAPHAASARAQLTQLKSGLAFYEDLPDGTLGDFVFPIEYDFSLRGRAFHKKGRKIQASMTVIQGRLDSLYTFKTDRKGNFLIEGLHFFDTLSFSFQAVDKKGKPFKSVELEKQYGPTIKKPINTKFLDVDTVLLEHPIQLIKLEQPLDSIGIAVDTKLAVTDEFSTADYLLTDTELRKMPQGQGILTALQGRIPGLTYNSSTRTLSFRGIKSSTQGGNEPLLVVDGTPYYATIQGNLVAQNQESKVEEQQNATSNDNHQQSQQLNGVRQMPNQGNQQSQSNSTTVGSTVMDMIGYLTVSGVSRVEVFSRMDPRYGSMGANGVIAITTRKDRIQTNKSALIIERQLIQGYQPETKFSIAEDYNDQGKHDYQPTVYWNPRAMIYPNQPLVIRFPGRITNEVYVISIGGVTKNGVPVYGEFLFDPRQNKSVNAHEVSLDQRQN